MSGFRILPALTAIAVAALPGFAGAADWPQWGRDATRNAVSSEKGVPLDFQLPRSDLKGNVVKPGRGVAWSADLGTRTVVPPVVADGLVWVCTDARPPADRKIPTKDWDGGVLMCLRESDGKLLWRHRTPRLSGDRSTWVEDFPRTPLGSCPLIEGDRLWYVTNRSEVVCLDVAPLKLGTGVPSEVWKLDMRKELGVFPHLPMMQFGFAASVAGYRDKLYVVTHNGVGGDHSKVPKPDAPSLVCLEKTTGKIVWKDNSPGKNILEHQISSPLVAEVNGKAQVIVGQGDGWLRSFDPGSGRLVWKCDLNPKAAKWKLGGAGNRNYAVATPILHDNRVYIATGLQIEAYEGPGCLYCIDPTKEGDVSRELDDEPGKGKPNPNSAVVWHTLGPFPDDVPDYDEKKNLLKERNYLFGRTVASCTAYDGLVYAVDVGSYFFCFDAKTGKPYWIADLTTQVRGQPLWVGGTVYLATDDGDILIFAHGKEKKRLARIEADHPCMPGPIFANGTLYVTTERSLYAVRRSK